MAIFLAAFLATNLISIAQEISLAASFEWNWDMTNKCGPRPQGPKYPEPPVNGTGSYRKPLECDIIPDGNYIFDYKCSAPCQMEPERTIHLECNCFTRVGPIKQVGQCKWEYVNSEECPEIPVSEQLDYECDPRNDTCAAYSKEPLVNAETTEDRIESEKEHTEENPQENMLATENITTAHTQKDDSLKFESSEDKAGQIDKVTTSGNPHWQMPMSNGLLSQMPMPQMSLPQMAGIGVPMNNMASLATPMGSPIIISPVMTQNVGDVSASHDVKEPEIASNPSKKISNEKMAIIDELEEAFKSLKNYRNHDVSSSQETLNDTAIITQDHIMEDKLTIEKQKEQIRSMKLLLKTAKDRAEETLNRSEQEKENLKVMYENVMKSKEEVHLETVRQLADLHMLLENRIFANTIVEMNASRTDDGTNAENSQESKLSRANVRRSRRSNY